MTNQKSTFNISPLVGLVMLGLVIFLFYMMFKGLFALASWAMPVLAIATLFIDYKVYVDFGKTLVNLFQRSIISGLAAVALTMLLFPLVILFLFSKAAIMRYAVASVKDNPIFQEQNPNEDYLDYEEIEEELEDIPLIELPPIQPKASKKTEENPFDQFFE